MRLIKHIKHTLRCWIALSKFSAIPSPDFRDCMEVQAVIDSK